MAGRVLIVEDEKAMVLALRSLLTREGYQVESADRGDEALRLIETGRFDVVITDLSLKGDVDGMDVLEATRKLDPDTAVIMITAYGSEKTAVKAMKLGAADYLPKPFDNDELRVVVRRVMETQLLRRDHRRLLEEVRGVYGELIGRSPAMRRVFEMIERVADTDVTVLIRGETGTGKELVANAIHYRSPRRSRALVKMNCAALSRELVESELFGHERGAFTGAIGRREGKFEAANGGTLFLDEVGDMPLETQAKLLRAIQEKEFERVGGNEPLRVDVRILAATNHDLEQAVAAGRFREDLYYRLRVVEIVIPPLAERREDIPLLVDHLLAGAAERFRRDAKPLAPEALRACMSHPWKGNVRELRSALEKALLLSPGSEITADDVVAAEGATGRSSAGSATAGTCSNANASAVTPTADAAGAGSDATTSAGAPSNGARSFREAKEAFVEAFERDFLIQALRRNDGNISRAAEEIGMYRQNFQQKMKELGISAAEAAADSQSDD